MPEAVVLLDKAILEDTVAILVVVEEAVVQVVLVLTLVHME
jgi:hypothetical protein